MNFNHLFKLISMLVVVLSVPVSSFSHEDIVVNYPKCSLDDDSFAEGIVADKYYFIGIDWRAVVPEELQKILNEIDVNVTDANGATPLHFAARWHHKDTEIFSMLLQHGANVNAQDKDGNTPTHDAINCSNNVDINIDIVKFLLKNGADVSIKNKLGIAVANATNKNQLSLLRNVTSRGDMELVSLLLENGADPNFKGHVSGYMSPLNNVVTHDAPSEIIALFLRLGADPNTAGGMIEVTPLHSAVMKGSYSLSSRQNKIDTIRLLLQHGANPNATASGPGDNPPMLTFPPLSFNDSEVFALLIEYGADVNARATITGNIILHSFAKFWGDNDGHIERFRSFDDYSEIEDIESYYFKLITDSVLLLLENGADINAKNVEGSTPLHLAVQSRKFKPGIISILLKNGANANIRNNAGKTALQLGEANEYFVNSEAYQLLREHTTVE